MLFQTCPAAGEESCTSFALAISHRRPWDQELYAGARQLSCRQSDLQPIQCLWCGAVLAAFESCVWDFLAACYLRRVRLPCRLMSSQIGALFLLQPQKLDEFDSVLKAAKAALLVLGQPLLAMLYEQRSPSACTGVAVTTRGRGREVSQVRRGMPASPDRSCEAPALAVTPARKSEGTKAFATRGLCCRGLEIYATPAPQPCAQSHVSPQP